jgi:hypothetical protein
MPRWKGQGPVSLLHFYDIAVYIFLGYFYTTESRHKKH